MPGDQGTAISQGDLVLTAYKLWEILYATLLLKNFEICKALGYIPEGYLWNMVGCNYVCVCL